MLRMLLLTLVIAGFPLATNAATIVVTATQRPADLNWWDLTLATDTALYELNYFVAGTVVVDFSGATPAPDAVQPEASISPFGSDGFRIMHRAHGSLHGLHGLMDPSIEIDLGALSAGGLPPVFDIENIFEIAFIPPALACAPQGCWNFQSDFPQIDVVPIVEGITFNTVAAVPEPSIGALLLVGAGLLGAARLRSRR